MNTFAPLVCALRGVQILAVESRLERASLHPAVAHGAVRRRKMYDAVAHVAGVAHGARQGAGFGVARATLDVWRSFT